MAAFYPVPPVITGTCLPPVPKDLWSSKTTDWLPGSGIAPPIFLEGPITDTQGNLFVVDVGQGRILKFAFGTQTWSLLVDYDGEPNGLALSHDGQLLVADYKNGILKCDPRTGEIKPLLARRNMERFKGPNDIIEASNGDICECAGSSIHAAWLTKVDFTDQGQTGMTDQTGLVYRLSPQGKLDTILSNGVSPNGLVLSPDEKVLYVAMTRENSVWRCPLNKDGTTTKAGKFFSTFGIAGPDGLTVDSEGNLFICHPSLMSVFVVDRHGVPLARIIPPEGSGSSVTNCIFGSQPHDRKRLYFTCSTVGKIGYVDWHCEGATPIRPSVL